MYACLLRMSTTRVCACVRGVFTTVLLVLSHSENQTSLFHFQKTGLQEVKGSWLLSNCREWSISGPHRTLLQNPNSGSRLIFYYTQSETWYFSIQIAFVNGLVSKLSAWGSWTPCRVNISLSNKHSELIFSESSRGFDGYCFSGGQSTGRGPAMAKIYEHRNGMRKPFSKSKQKCSRNKKTEKFGDWRRNWKISLIAYSAVSLIRCRVCLFQFHLLDSHSSFRFQK